MSLDKRCYIRYEVPDDFLFIACRKTGRLARVKNISTTGLAFEYSPVADKEPYWKEIDIFTTNEMRFRLSEITCKIVYDIDALPENSAFTGSISRLTGLQFVGLSNEQQKKIDYLIDFRLYPPTQE